VAWAGSAEREHGGASGVWLARHTLGQDGKQSIVCLQTRRLEDAKPEPVESHHALTSSISEHIAKDVFAAVLLELDPGLRVCAEESALVVRKLLNIRLEGVILKESKIGDQHHRAGGFVPVLRATL